MIRLGNVGVGEFKADDESYVSPAHAADLKRHAVEAGDLVIAALAEPVGRCCRVPASVLPAIVKADCVRFKPDPEVSATFLMHWLNSPEGAKNAERHSHGVGRLRINMQEMRLLEVPLAPGPEQLRIVAEIEKHFTRLDEAVATLKAVQAKLKRARASVLKAAVEGRLVPTEARLARAEGRSYEPASVLLERILAERRARWPEGKKYQPPAAPKVDDAPSLPEGWIRATVDQLAGLVTKGTTPTSVGHGFTDEGVLFVKVESLAAGSIVHSACGRISAETHATLGRSQLRAADLLVSIAGTLGRIARVRERDVPANTNQAVAIVRPVERSMTPFLLHSLASVATGSQVVESRRGVGLQNLNLQQVAGFMVALAPLAEQSRIVAEVERRLSVIDNLEHTVVQTLARCGRLRQSILKRAFEGKLVPQDPADEPASELLARIRAQRAAEARA